MHTHAHTHTHTDTHAHTHARTHTPHFPITEEKKTAVGKTDRLETVWEKVSFKNGFER